jgi:predicted transcriptional regulator
MNYKSFKESLKLNPIEIFVDDLSKKRIDSLDNEALFQLPFIAMVILVIAKGASKPSIPELGRLVGECLEKTMPAYKKSSQHISWSANLRIRTVKAMSFLEMAGLVEIGDRKGKLRITELGKKVISRALDENTDLSHNLSIISRQFRHINKADKMELRLL